MKVIKPSRIREFCDKYPDSKSSLTGWLMIAKQANWRGLNDNRKTIATADIVPTPKGSIAVFNIGGNKYRLLCAIHFNRKIIFVPDFLPHAEYSKGTWKQTL
jgi:mRNA interferase HigB